MNKIIEKYWILFATFMLILRMSGSLGAIIAFIFLIFYAAFGKQHTIFAFLLSWIFVLINPVIAVNPSVLAIVKPLIIISGFTSAVFSYFYQHSHKASKISFLTAILVLIIVIHSLFFSYNMAISLLKILLWFFTFVTLYYSWSSLILEERTKVFGGVVNFLQLLLVISIPLLLIPSIGFAVNGTGFQGIFNHPQVLGPTFALLGVILASKIINSNRFELKSIFLLFICIVFIILSEARTAGLAFIGPLIIIMLLKPFNNRKDGSFLKNKKNIIFILFVLVTIVVILPTYSSYLTGYIFKRADSTNIIDVANASRGGLVDVMLENIRSKLLFGIGFGLASDPSMMDVQVDPFFGIPISATVEKGVLLIAVLEELGLIVAVYFYFWLFYILYRSSCYGLQNLSIVLCIIFINFGENTFFSVGGLGMLLIILLTASITKSKDIKVLR